MDNKANIGKGEVVSLFGKTTEASVKAKLPTTVVGGNSETFLDVIKKNNERLERMRSDRLKANESVLKSYRIKN